MTDENNNDLEEYIRKLFLNGRIRDEIIEIIVNEKDININETCKIVDKVYKKVKKSKEYKEYVKQKALKYFVPKWAENNINFVSKTYTTGRSGFYNLYFTNKSVICHSHGPINHYISNHDYFLTHVKKLEKMSPDEIISLNSHNFKVSYDNIKKVKLTDNYFKFYYKKKTLRLLLRREPIFYFNHIYNQKKHAENKNNVDIKIYKYFNGKIYEK